MVDTTDEFHPQRPLDAVDTHVRAPIATAIQIVEQERTEVRAERDAFEAF